MKTFCVLVAAALLCGCAAPNRRDTAAAELFREPKPPTAEDVAAQELRRRNRAAEVYRAAYDFELLSPAERSEAFAELSALRPRTIREALAADQPSKNEKWGHLRARSDPNHYEAKTRGEDDGKREAASRRRESFIAAHPELEVKVVEMIRSRRYGLDWPEGWVLASMGEPQSTSTSVSALGSFESWSYRSGNEVIYFLNGRVVRWYLSN